MKVGSLRQSAQLEQAARTNPKTWVVRNDGAGKRMHFLVRADGSEYFENSQGVLIRYTFDGAVKRAMDLNSDESGN